ncbi:hypothetical protein, partial [Selenomonas noxia]|uniref:hypothetical protein n=1 Tax=Selenomonas noxia TaxID=135083 RepID=UPI0028E85711
PPLLHQRYCSIIATSSPFGYMRLVQQNSEEFAFVIIPPLEYTRKKAPESKLRGFVSYYR